MGVAMGLISSMLGLGGGLGLVMSGVIVDHGSWRLLFVVGAVIGLLGMVLVARFIPSSPQRSAATLDIPGALLLSARADLHPGRPHRGAQLGLGLGPLRRRRSAPAWLILLVWGWVESRTAQPMVDMRMLSRRPVLFTNLAALFCGFTMYAIFTVLPLFSQMPSGLPPDVASLVTYGFGASVTVSALYLLPGRAGDAPRRTLRRRARALGRPSGSRSPSAWWSRPSARPCSPPSTPSPGS